MKLNVDFSNLHIATAKMKGLEALVNELRRQKVTYEDGLAQAVEFTRSNGGHVEEREDKVTRLTLNDFSVDCFQPYPDIDVFYFEY
ncbi:hypothetical protein [Vibrio sp. TBV020]|uniref:hypothetical protein n=1 Tax=Vibrio sp. TBV020 TaxID=3137398 RepID=UPI0038CD819D